MSPDTPVYVPGYGEMTAGQVAAILRTEQTPQESQWEADLRRLEAVCTEHLCLAPACGDTPPDGRA